MARRSDAEPGAFIPGSAAELTPAWLTEAMQLAGAIDGLSRIDACRSEPLSDGGVGLSGDTVRVHLEGRLGGAEPTTIIAKFPTAVVANRGMIEAFDGYAREIVFYQDLALQVPVSVPAHLGSAMDPRRRGLGAEAGRRFAERLPARAHLAVTADITKFMRPSKRRYVLLLEDLGADTTVFDLENPPSADRVVQIAEALAAVHAAMWGRRDLADHASTRTLVTDMPRMFVSVYAGRSRAVAAQRWGHWLTEDDYRRLDEAARRFAADVAILNEPYTFVHGDPRSDNVLFGPDGLTLLDWAMPGVGHPGFDLGYLLGSSLRGEDAGQTADIIDAYLAALIRGGAELTRGELVRGVQASARSGLILQVNSLTVLEGLYGDHMPADLWAPRLLSLTRALD